MVGQKRVFGFLFMKYFCADSRKRCLWTGCPFCSSLHWRLTFCLNSQMNFGFEEQTFVLGSSKLTCIYYNRLNRRFYFCRKINDAFRARTLYKQHFACVYTATCNYCLFNCLSPGESNRCLIGCKFLYK